MVVTDERSDPVPRLLQPKCAEDAPAARTGTLKAVAFFWMLPHRHGPQLASKAPVYPVIGSLLAGVMITLAVLAAIARLMTGFHRTTSDADFHEAILYAAAETASSPAGWLVPIGAAIAPISVVLLGVTLGLLAAPWWAAGDAPRSVVARSIRGALWAITPIIPGGLVILLVFALSSPGRPAAPYWLSSIPPGPAWSLPDMSDARNLIVYVIIPSLVLLWCVWTFFCSRRYVGPAVGPGFEPIEPRCESCGYRLAGLPMDGRCPECGLAVCDSLPGGRRAAPLAPRPDLPRDPGVRWCVMQARFIGSSDEFDRIRLRAPIGTAAALWWLHCAFIAALAGLGAQVAEAVGVPVDVPWHVGPTFAIGVLVVLPLVQSLLMWCACLWCHARYGMRDYRMAAAVCLYAAPLMWPAAAVAIAIALCPSSDGQVNLFGAHNLAMGCAAGFLAILLWIGRIAAGLRRARFANS